MAAQFVLDIDAGGASTRAVLMRDDELISRHSIGPINVILHSDASNRLVALIEQTADPAAQQILEGAADHLIALATALRSMVGDLPVVMVGGVFEIPSIAERFIAATNADRPLEAPELGAIGLARGERNSRDAALVT